MSVKLVDDIVDKHYIEIDPEMIRKVKVSWFSVFFEYLSILLFNSSNTIIVLDRVEETNEVIDSHQITGTWSLGTLMTYFVKIQDDMVP